MVCALPRSRVVVFQAVYVRCFACVSPWKGTPPSRLTWGLAIGLTARYDSPAGDTNVLLPQCFNDLHLQPQPPAVRTRTSPCLLAGPTRGCSKHQSSSSRQLMSSGPRGFISLPAKFSCPWRISQPRAITSAAVVLVSSLLAIRFVRSACHRPPCRTGSPKYAVASRQTPEYLTALTSVVMVSSAPVSLRTALSSTHHWQAFPWNDSPARSRLVFTMVPLTTHRLSPLGPCRDMR